MSGFSREACSGDFDRGPVDQSMNSDNPLAYGVRERKTTRRDFLKLAGGAVVTILGHRLLTACAPPPEVPPTPTTSPVGPGEEILPGPTATAEIECSIDDSSMSQERFSSLSLEFQRNYPGTGMIAASGFEVGGSMNGSEVRREFLVVGRSLEELALILIQSEEDGTDSFTRLTYDPKAWVINQPMPTFGILSEKDGKKVMEHVLSIDPNTGKGILFDRAVYCEFNVGNEGSGAAKNALTPREEYIALLGSSQVFAEENYLAIVGWGLRQVVDEQNNITVEMWNMTNGKAVAEWSGNEWKMGKSPFTQTNRGSVYVNADGRLMLVNSKGGESPVAFENLEFGGIQGASTIVKAMYPKEFEVTLEGDQLALKDFLYPSNVKLAEELQWNEDGTLITGTFEDLGYANIHFYGKALKPTMVDGQMVLFYAVPNCHEPVPQVLTRELREGEIGVGGRPVAISFPTKPIQITQQGFVSAVKGEDIANVSYQPNIAEFDTFLRGKRVYTTLLTKIFVPTNSSEYREIERQYGSALGGDDYMNENSLLMRAREELGEGATPGEILQKAMKLAEGKLGWTGFVGGGGALYVLDYNGQ